MNAEGTHTIVIPEFISVNAEDVNYWACIQFLKILYGFGLITVLV